MLTADLPAPRDSPAPSPSETQNYHISYQMPRRRSNLGIRKNLVLLTQQRLQKPLESECKAHSAQLRDRAASEAPTVDESVLAQSPFTRHCPPQVSHTGTSPNDSRDHGVHCYTHLQGSNQSPHRAISWCPKRLQCLPGHLHIPGISMAQGHHRTNVLHLTNSFFPLAVSLVPHTVSLTKKGLRNATGGH